MLVVAVLLLVVKVALRVVYAQLARVTRKHTWVLRDYELTINTSGFQILVFESRP